MVQYKQLITHRQPVLLLRAGTCVCMRPYTHPLHAHNSARPHALCSVTCVPSRILCSPERTPKALLNNVNCWSTDGIRWPIDGNRMHRWKKCLSRFLTNSQNHSKPPICMLFVICHLLLFSLPFVICHDQYYSPNVQKGSLIDAGQKITMHQAIQVCTRNVLYSTTIKAWIQKGC